MKLQHFDNPEAALAYVFDELIATLEDDYRRMRGVEREHYSDADRATAKAKLSDLRAIESNVRFVPRDEPTP